MSRTDFIGDFLTVIRNAARAGKDKVTLPASNISIRIAELLKDEGFINQVKVFEEGKKRFVRIHLKYMAGNKAAIQGMRRISTPGCRRYVGFDEIPKVQGGLGIAIVSTSRGVMADRQAREIKMGGELLCTVW